VRMHLLEETAALPGAPGQRDIELYRSPQTDGAGAERATLALLPDDPLRAALLQAPGPVALERVPASSPAASEMRDGGMGSAVPLVDRGELVGLMALSEQPCSFDVRERVAALGTALAPALRVAQRIHEQEMQTRGRERVEQELELARRIQQSFLPHTVPSLDGWQITSHYRPAREVGGDFYDVLALADGRLGLIVGDVTDKGVPAALVMAATRSMLRAAAQQQGSPGAVLAQVSDLLCPDVPPGMFVTCFYAILDPATGHLRYANAGHELPYHRHEGTVTELFATGMPLGLLPASVGLLPARRYEEGEAVLQPGDTVLLYSDGLVEAHDRRREMFGRTRLARLVGEGGGDTALIDRVLAGLVSFTPPDWEQEDDITLVTLQRRVATASDVCRVLDAWTLSSVPGNERLAMRRVSQAVQGVRLGEERLAQLETAVAEATLNAMEHGNGFQADQMVEFQVLVSPTTLIVRIGDQGSGPLDLPAPVPDLAAKLAGEQTPRGWGLYLIKHLVDDLRVGDTLTRHTVELRMALSEGSAPGAAGDSLGGSPPLQQESMTSPESGENGPPGSTEE
jgi:serine phosphatase RsbU (regulator of sigma subunit)/anti-sigma regulatory factor (Ser/Thr protein kinase)